MGCDIGEAFMSPEDVRLEPRVTELAREPVVGVRRYR
ncbi:MAG: hypothetical protein ACI8RA_000403, partial [Chlamydiales bacterium]